jgi:small subunit ribosomal protein S20
MPNLANAKKAMRVSDRKRIVNDRRRKAMRVTIKTVKKSLDVKTDLSLAYQAIDKAAKRGVIKPNTAARKKSRLNAQIKKANAAN